MLEVKQRLLQREGSDQLCQGLLTGCEEDENWELSGGHSIKLINTVLMLGLGGSLVHILKAASGANIIHRKKEGIKTKSIRGHRPH